MNTPDPLPAPAAPAVLPPPPPKPKMKGWKKALLITGSVLLGLIVFILVAGPAIIGFVAQSKIPAIVREKLQATATVANVSFSWSGHLQIDDLRLVPKNFSEPLLEVKKVDVRIDLGSAIGGKYIADVEVAAPKILVEKGADGKFNYEFPPQAPTPADPKAKQGSGKKPFVQANLKIHDGEVKIRGKGRETIYQNLTLNANVDTLDKPVDYDLSLESPLKDTLKIKGGIDINTISGPATVTLERLSLRNLTGAARAYSDVIELDGTVNGVLHYEIKDAKRIAGNSKIEVFDFSVLLPAEQRVKLDHLTLTHDGAIDEKGSGRHVVMIESGKALSATITTVVADAFNTRDAKTDVRVDSDLAALAEILRGSGKLPKGMALAGALSLRGTCNSRGPSQADLDANKLRIAAVVDLTLAGSDLDLTMDGKPMKLDGFRIHHAGTLDESGAGRNTITLELGKALGATATVDVTDALGNAPAVQTTLKASSDLGELGKVLEKLIGLKPDMALEGSASIKGVVRAKGSESVKADLVLNASDIVAVDVKEKKRHEIDKVIDLKLIGGWDGKTKTAAADLIKLTSSFATMDGKGGVSLAAPMTVKESSFQLKADLEKLGAKLGLFMANAPGLAGSVSATASYAGDRYTLEATAKGVKIVSKGKTTGPIDATVAQKGTFSTAKDGAFRIETGVVTSSAADLRVSGEIRKVLEDGREGEIRIDAVARPVELSKWVPDLNLGGPEIKLTAAVSLKLNLITVKGQTKIDGLTMTDKDDKGVPVTKTARTGTVDFAVTMKDPDLLATLKTPSFEWLDKGYSAKGGLETQVSYNDMGTTGSTKLTNLEFTDDKKNVVKDPGLTIVHDIGLANGNKTIDLRKAEISSSFLKGTISGRVLRLDPALEFQKLRLAFRYIPDKLGAVAQPWLPGKLEGSEERILDITVDGKAASTDTLAILRGTRGGIDLDLAKFTMEGVSVAGKTHLDLKDGKMASDTPLSVNKGKTDLNASLDFNAAEKKPQSTLTFNAKDVDANGQMGPLLEKINPIFHTSGVDAKVDGRIQSDFKMVWTGPLDPGEKDWPAAASRSLGGTGIFGAQNLNIAGSPTVGQIMAALGQGNALQGELVATQIRIANGRCEYENMTMRGSRKDAAALKRDQEQLAADRQQLEADKAHLNPKEFQKRQEELRMKEEDLPFRYVLRFSGWVGFDKKMELRVLMPMSDGLAKAHPSLTKYIGTSFWVDLKGTTDHPSLDTKKMLAEAIKRAAEGILMDKLDDALKGLFDKKKKDEKKDDKK